MALEDNKARTAAIMDKMGSMKDDAPTDVPAMPGADMAMEKIVAAEDIKAGDEIDIKDGMAYCKKPEGSDMGAMKEEAPKEGVPA
jgi:hypothetical protein